jgi:hypothetical protein
MVWNPPEYLEKPMPGILCRISVTYAKDIIARGGRLQAHEVISKDGYAMGWLTPNQIKTLRKQQEGVR